jgi:hypothetical protein
MKGWEGKTKMHDFLRLEFLSTLKVLARNHMKRAYLEIIDTLPFFMLQKVLILSPSVYVKGVGAFQEFYSKTYLESRKYSITHPLASLQQLQSFNLHLCPQHKSHNLSHLQRKWKWSWFVVF